VTTRAQLQSLTRAYLLGLISQPEFRAALVEAADALAEADEAVRTLYGRLWDRLSEQDYGHIDESAVKIGAAELIGESAPRAQIWRGPADLTSTRTTAAWPVAPAIEIVSSFTPSQLPLQQTSTQTAGV